MHNSTGFPAGRQPQPPPITTTIRYTCGHETTQKHLQSVKCPPCRDEAKRAKRLHRWGKDNEKERVGKNALYGRLPDGAAFAVVYNATRTVWSGHLTVGDITVTAEAAAVFKLLSKLDRLYRKAVGHVQ